MSTLCRRAKKGYLVGLKGMPKRIHGRYRDIKSLPWVEGAGAGAMSDKHVQGVFVPLSRCVQVV
eukprot:1193708-Pleurochrysis_carterae.AAC.1